MRELTPLPLPVRTKEMVAMGAIAGRAARLLLTAVLGVTLGFFVAVSVFADGAGPERRATFGILLLGYGLAGAAFGVLAPPRYGLGLALPGVAALGGLAALGEGHPWHAPYAALIIASAMVGAAGTRAARNRIRRRRGPAA